MAKKKPATGHIINRRARHDYAVGDEFVVGVVLSGAETKSLRRGHGHLRGAYVTVKEGEIWLTNATITGDKGIQIAEQDQTRARKLLAKHREIEQLMQAKQQGLTIIPLEILTRGRYVKIRIATARGKKKYDKRQVLKKRDEVQQINRAMTNK